MPTRKDLGLNISNAIAVAIAYGLLVFINIFSPMKFYTLDWTTMNLLIYIAPVSILPILFGFRIFGAMTVLGYYIGLTVTEILVYMDMLERNSTEALGIWAIHLAAFTVASIFMEIFAYRKRKRIREQNARRRAEREEQNQMVKTVAAALAAGATITPPPQAPVQAQPSIPPQAPVQAQPMTPPQAPVQAQPSIPPQAPVQAQPMTPPQAPVQAQPSIPPQAPVPEQPPQQSTWQ